MMYAIILLVISITFASTQSTVENTSKLTPEMEDALDQIKKEMCHYNQENMLICKDPLSNNYFEFKLELDQQNMEADEALYAAAAQYISNCRFTEDEILKVINARHSLVENKNDQVALGDAFDDYYLSAESQSWWKGLVYRISQVFTDLKQGMSTQKGYWDDTKLVLGDSSTKPKSICHVQDTNGLCLIWLNYNTQYLPNGASSDLAGFSDRCIEAGMTAQVRCSMAAESVSIHCVGDSG